MPPWPIIIHVRQGLYQEGALESEISYIFILVSSLGYTTIVNTEPLAPLYEPLAPL